MSLYDWQRERYMRKLLKTLAYRQRVAMILQPGNVWVVENAPPDKPKKEEALRTCHLRGWIEPIVDAVPKGKLTAEGQLPDGDIFSHVGPIYRLTESGWNTIRRTHSWIVFTFVVASLTLVASVIGILIVSFANL